MHVSGYFGLGDWVEDGCMECFCSEHSQNCSSATGWYSTETVNDWNVLDKFSATQSGFTGKSDSGEVITVDDPVSADFDPPQ